MFSLSGLVLNHPSLFARFDVSRAILPSSYHYHNWNQGLIKGSIVWKKQVLLYGNNGIWLTNREASAFTAFNNGLPEGAGWLLRPPALIAIASGKIPPVPFSTMDSRNAWHDKLRSLRYDNTAGEWLMYSSDGFYTMKQLGDKPAAAAAQPPVSVMGINVEERDSDGTWLIGSFNGMYRWDRRNNRVTDYFTGQPARPAKGIPVTDNAIAGYSPHFGKGPVVINYGKGTTALPMPQRMEVLPMSLRNVCLEIHTGRMYTFLGGVTVLYICLMGIAVFWCLWTG